ncbi:helix-turn-helix transcriptional regulator [Janthinobacterium psychrotolerans]|uniref:DNA-binding transcriptional regulator, CsgD family n=1 Tax=Janthinobacterium psychrotolerans TaxID=1747903 RepID=A0A1A7C0X0_9BURK|nr:helix-turn-helix transcriptional regulator [Janthinobacterium psychrotolerans]OBV38380.1 DNA-binding transcriptional regulator, CsgD family [Janthinobacterium psychrotolerans]
MTPSLHQASQTLTTLIYEAATRYTGWQDFLTAFSVHMGSHAGMIWAHDFNNQSVDIHLPGSGLAATWGFTPQAMASFASYYGTRNVWLENPALHREGAIVTGSMLFPDYHLKKTEYWTDWLRPQNIFYTAAAIVELRAERSTNITVVRAEKAGNYSAGELALARTLMPHLQTAFALQRKLRRLEVLSQSSTEVLEMLPFGVLLLDASSLLLYANERALAMASATRLLQLREGAPLYCPREADNGALRRTLHQAAQTGTAADGGPGGVLTLQGLTGERLRLRVTPMPSWHAPFGSASAIAVFINDGNNLTTSLLDTLRHFYGMTVAEARLTEALVNGYSLQEYATRQEISIHTARTQIKTATAKAGAQRQVDLVRIVLTGPAVLQRMARRG